MTDMGFLATAVEDSVRVGIGLSIDVCERFARRLEDGGACPAAVDTAVALAESLRELSAAFTLEGR